MLLKNSYSYGVKSEEIAMQYFKSLGFSVLAQRYKTKYGEIDLIVSQDHELVFVEVKARKRPIALENILIQKQISRNYSAAEIFLSVFDEYKDYICRFDLIVIFGDKISHHIKNVYLE